MHYSRFSCYLSGIIQDFPVIFLFLNLFWIQCCHRTHLLWFQFSKLLSCFNDAGSVLFWHTFPGHVTKMCALLLVDGMFYKRSLDPVGWWWYSFLYHCCSLVFLPAVENEELKFPTAIIRPLHFLDLWNLLHTFC